jgi:hypothetical protein
VRALDKPSTIHSHGVVEAAVQERSGPSVHAVMSLLDHLDIGGCAACESLRNALLAWIRGHSAELVHPAPADDLRKKATAAGDRRLDSQKPALATNQEAGF